MKLSEAIRAGVKLDGKQIYECLYEFDNTGKAIGCCALGAAKIGAINSVYRKDLEKVSLHGLFPELKDAVVNDCDLYTIIAIRNDRKEGRGEHAAEVS